jgi:L-alanine-DL-glutamate epimerase-like enolase superfamily enzyme
VEYLTPSPYIEEIISTPFSLDTDGLLTIPTTPGLGIEINPDGLAKYSDVKLTR